MMRHLRFLLVFVLVAAVLAIVPASTVAAVSYTSLNRFVYGEVISPGTAGTSGPTNNFGQGPWVGNKTVVELLGSAGGTQISSLDTTNIIMSGELSASMPAGYTGEAQSGLNAQLTLSNDTPFFYSWTKTSDVLINGTIIAKTGGGGPIYNSFQSSGSGLLPAGNYFMGFYFYIPITSAGGTKSGTYTFNLSFTPEPSSIMLGLIGGMPLLTIRRRR
jgi:hypothetical protein